jgi:hypothetical protein
MVHDIICCQPELCGVTEETGLGCGDDDLDVSIPKPVSTRALIAMVMCAEDAVDPANAGIPCENFALAAIDEQNLPMLLDETHIDHIVVDADVRGDCFNRRFADIHGRLSPHLPPRKLRP